MKKNILIFITAMLVIAGTFVSNAALAAPVDKVGVCHRTASESNPYVYIEVPESEANGHITGTGKQHNHKVYWKSDGVWNGISHKAGDERVDYLATGTTCESGSVPPETPSPVVTTQTKSVDKVLCTVIERTTYVREVTTVGETVTYGPWTVDSVVAIKKANTCPEPSPDTVYHAVKKPVDRPHKAVVGSPKGQPVAIPTAVDAGL